MNWLILFIRIAITLTFLLLAAGGPYALFKLRAFITQYVAAHKVLEARVEAIERRLQMVEQDGAHD